MKKGVVLGVGLILSIGLSFVSYAGWEKQEDNTWKYKENGVYLNNGWNWIDGDNDGVAECYYLGEDSILAVTPAKPEGYEVNVDGAWVVNGVVQTRQTSVSGVGISLEELRKKPYGAMTEEEKERYIREVVQYDDDGSEFSRSVVESIKYYMRIHDNDGSFSEGWKNKKFDDMTELELDTFLTMTQGGRVVHLAPVVEIDESLANLKLNR